MEKISVIACPAPGCGDVLMVFLMSIINRTQALTYQIHQYPGRIEKCLCGTYYHIDPIRMDSLSNTPDILSSRFLARSSFSM